MMPGLDLARASAVLGANPATAGVQVVFARPVLTGWVSLEHSDSMAATVALLMRATVHHGFIARTGDAYLDKVRNKLITQFLIDFPTCDNFFFLDDDVGWPAEKVLEFIRRPEPILAGIYPKKDDALDFPVSPLVNLDTGELIERDGLVRVQNAPTGFLRIKRSVLERLAGQSRTFLDMERDGPQRYHEICQVGLVGGDEWYWGEDSILVKKWLDLGGEVWADPNIDFSHRGTKKWCANLSQHLDKYRERGREAAAAHQARQAP